MTQAPGNGRQRLFPRARATVGQAVLACLAALPPCTASAMPDATPPSCQLDWQAHRQGDRLEVAPLVTCDRPCRLRFLITTVDAPSQALRQSGSVHVTSATPRQLGRMVLAPASAACRLQLTLWHEDGSEQRFTSETCPAPP